MVRKQIEDEYRGQRRGGGTRIVTIHTCMSYREISIKVLDAFFKGRKSKGLNLKNYTYDGLGLFQGIIPEQGFNLGIIIKANGGASKTKLYGFLTAKKVNTKFLKIVELGELPEKKNKPLLT